jgi:hypothetical protein
VRDALTNAEPVERFRKLASLAFYLIRSRASGGVRDYFAFGQELVAPADGVVTDVIKGVADNRPGVVKNFADMGKR